MLRPGEEDEKLLAYLSKKEHCNIAVLSITRGEQMTNYAGYEKNVDLGIIHTEELSKAASVSGFQPMVTSMMDLGTYNSYNDIFSVWSEDTLVSNIVWAIRYFRPDIIITPKTNDSDSINNILINTIIDANSKAANKDYYSIQLAGRFSFLDINSAKQIYLQMPDSSAFEKDSCVAINTNSIDESSQKTIREIAQEACLCERSIFKDLNNISLRKDVQYLKPVLSSSKNLFENIDTSRAHSGSDFQGKINAIIQQFDFFHPENSIKSLTDLYMQISQSGIDKFWKKTKLDELQNIILSCAGISLEASCDKPFGVFGQQDIFSVSVKNNLSNIQIHQININDSSYKIDTSLQAKSNYFFQTKYLISGNNAYQPFWLNSPLDPKKKYYIIDDSMTDRLIDTACYSVTIFITVDNLPLKIKAPLMYKIFDRQNGTIENPFYTIEPVQVSLRPTVLLTNVFGDTKANKNSDITLRFTTYFESSGMPMILKVKQAGLLAVINGKAALTYQPKELYHLDTTMSFKYGDAFSIKIPFKNEYINKNEPASKLVKPYIDMNLKDGAESFNSNIKEVNYNYIPTVIYNYHDMTSVVDDTIFTKGKRVAYLFGLNGDAINNALYQLGYKIDNLNLSDIQLDSLKQYDAVIIGNNSPIYNLDNDELKNAKFIIETYVYQGGTIISLSNNNELNNLLPLQVSSTPQNISGSSGNYSIVVENDTSLFNYPNKINIRSIAGWDGVLAYGFPNKFDTKYQSPLQIKSLQDNSFLSPILYAKYGSGFSVYCNIDLSSQTMNAQPDAFRLLANIIAISFKNKHENR